MTSCTASRAWTKASASELGRAIHSGATTAVEIAEAHLAAIEALNPQLTSLISWQREATLERARSADRDLLRTGPRSPHR